MKVIDLLNKIANGEEVPKKIHIKQFQTDFIFNGYTYLSNEKERQNIYWHLHSGALNYEVEIIEEDNKDNFTGWKMYQDGKEVCSIDYSTNEEKKIPKKLDEDNAIWEEQARDIDYYFKNTINEIIDYLESQV